jgi:hypothetical protein
MKTVHYSGTAGTAKNFAGMTWLRDMHIKYISDRAT